jgi:RHS repeat-associated protein
MQPFDNYNNLGITTPTQVYGKAVLLNTQVKSLPTWSVTRILYGSGNVTTQKSYTLYDAKARPVYNYTTHESGGYTAVETKIDFAGKVLETRTKHKRTSSVAELTTQEFFTYAPQGQMISHIHQVGSDAPQQLSVPEYDALGQLIQKKVGGLAGGSPLQRVDYRYNIRGWMTQINDVNTLNDDLFAFKINYNVRDHHESTLLYNGNISSTYWRTQTDNTKRHYNYQYDALNRMTSAHYGKNDILTHNYNESLSYDKNGNILYLSRYGINDFGDPIPIDDIFYNYGNAEKSNKLMRVTETPYGNSAQGFKDGTNTGDDYMYDDFGNMNKDQNKGITNITYNHLNLPKQITFANNNSIIYIYNALGVKLRKKVKEADTQAMTHYLGTFQYNNNNLQYIHTSEGYVRHTPPSNSVDGTLGAFDYVYNYTDHLGNIRLSYTLDPSDQVIKILEENHYYPFGMKHTYNVFKKDIRTVDAEIDLNGNLVNPTNNLTNFEPSEDIRRVRMVSNTGYQYKYQGQERQDELGLGWDSFKWRNYDYAIGRFMCIDPLSEKYAYNSTYAFQENKMGLGRELEGLEMVSERSKDGKSITLTITVNPVNNTPKADGTGNVLSDQDFNMLVEKRAESTVNIFNGKTKEGETVNTKINFDKEATITWEYNLMIDIEESATNQESLGQMARGFASHIGNTQENKAQVNVYSLMGKGSGLNITEDGIKNASVTGTHEDAHMGGLNHNENYKNIMNSPAPVDAKMQPIQRSFIIFMVEQQQNKRQ